MQIVAVQLGLYVTAAGTTSYAYISVAFIQVGPPGHFTHIFITTSVISALNRLSRISNGYFKPLLDPGGGFRNETAVTKPFRK
jgi:hypothetical protein